MVCRMCRVERSHGHTGSITYNKHDHISFIASSNSRNHDFFFQCFKMFWKRHALQLLNVLQSFSIRNFKFHLNANLFSIFQMICAQHVRTTTQIVHKTTTSTNNKFKTGNNGQWRPRSDSYLWWLARLSFWLAWQYDVSIYQCFLRNWLINLTN